MSNLDLTGIGMTSQRTRDRLLDRLRQQGIENQRVLEIIGKTPRHIFIDEALAHRAYEDTALPIGFEQTISQPFIVARMTEALFVDGNLGKVLEIGTGCGYQTSILSHFAERVFTVERIKGLQHRARTTLKKIGLRNIQYRYSDGGMGWMKNAPYDGIIVTAAPGSVPTELISQLAPGGRIIIPVGSGEVQELQCITMQDDQIKTEVLELVRFVPLLGGTRS